MSATAPRFEPIKGSPPSIEWIAIASLRIDEAYQRSIEAPASQRLILEIACHWDWRLFSPLNVSRREEGLFVLDGQHRLEAAKVRGDIPHLPAIVARFESVREEAKAFVDVNTLRKNPTPLDKFNARCVAGDEAALQLRSIALAAGVKIARSSWTLRDGEVACVAVMARLLKQYGEKYLSAALVNMAEAWPGQPLRVANEMLPGICLLLYGVPPDFDPDLFVEVLRSREQLHWFMHGKSNDGDPEAEWPDEVFRDMLLKPYTEAAAKRKQRS